MNHYANVELCRELKGLSGWRTEAEHPDGPLHLDTHFAYTLGFLFRKLPIGTAIGKSPRSFGEDVATFYSKWNQLYQRTFEADTPEDAAARLAIELFKLGILTKDSA